MAPVFSRFLAEGTASEIARSTENSERRQFSSHMTKREIQWKFGRRRPCERGKCLDDACSLLRRLHVHRGTQRNQFDQLQCIRDGDVVGRRPSPLFLST